MSFQNISLIKTKKKIISYAFIDANNLILGLKKADIKLDYKNFFRFLKDKYRVEKAFWIVGYRDEFSDIYQQLRNVGFTLLFKKTTKSFKGEIKGNVDVFLTVQSIRSLQKFDRFILVSGDGDFLELIHYMKEQKKEVKILIPFKKHTPSLFRGLSSYIICLDSEKIRKKNIIRKKMLTGASFFLMGAFAGDAPHCMSYSRKIPFYFLKKLFFCQILSCLHFFYTIVEKNKKLLLFLFKKTRFLFIPVVQRCITVSILEI